MVKQNKNMKWIKRQGSTELPRFIVGALATAGASLASGATVQIAFGNNVVSLATGTTNFVGDLTGDNHADMRGIANGATYHVVSICSAASLGIAVWGGEPNPVPGI